MENITLGQYQESDALAFANIYYGTMLGLHRLAFKKHNG